MRLVRKNWLGKCQRKEEVAEELEFIDKERLENGQGDMEKTGERAELWQVWLEAAWYWNIAHVALCSTKTSMNLCSWQRFTTTCLAHPLQRGCFTARQISRH